MRKCTYIFIYTYIFSYIIIQHLDFPLKGSLMNHSVYTSIWHILATKLKLLNIQYWYALISNATWPVNQDENEQFSFILVWVLSFNLQYALFAMNLPTGMLTPQDLPLNILFLKPQMDCQWRMGRLGRTSKSPGEIHGLGICQKDSTWFFIVLILMLRHRWIEHRMKWYILPKMVEFIEWPLQAALWRHKPFFRAVDTGHPGTIF